MWNSGGGALYSCPDELHAGTAEFVEVRRATRHAHDQCDSRSEDQGATAGAKRPVVCPQLEVGNVRTTRDGEVAVGEEFSDRCQSVEFRSSSSGRFSPG